MNAKKTRESSPLKEDTQPTTDVGSVDFYIGKSHDSTGNYGRFLMNDFVIYYKALSDKEISLINGQVTKGMYGHIFSLHEKLRYNDFQSNEFRIVAIFCPEPVF